MSHSHSWVRTVYVYLFSLIGLVLVIIACVRFIDMGLKAWVFTQADQYQYSIEYARPAMLDENGEKVSAEEMTEEEKETLHNTQIAQRRQRDAASALAQLIVGLPLYLYHWRLAGRRKET